MDGAADLLRVIAWMHNDQPRCFTIRASHPAVSAQQPWQGRCRGLVGIERQAAFRTSRSRQPAEVITAVDAASSFQSLLRRKRITVTVDHCSPRPVNPAAK